MGNLESEIVFKQESDLNRSLIWLSNFDGSEEQINGIEEKKL